MKKLNNKGMTTIEILVTFVIVMIIVISMYASISNLNDRQTIASYKESVITYKDLLTKEIQDDLITKQLVSVKINSNTSAVLFFKDGTQKNLTVTKVSQTIPNDVKELKSCKPSSSGSESITYGDNTYPLPNLGNDGYMSGDSCVPISNLTIGDITISDRISDSELGVFIFKVEFNHPDLGNKYSINIVSPIDYH